MAGGGGAVGAMEVAHSKGDARPASAAAAAAAASRRHDTFPRWFRMAAKLATLVLLLALPSLALRDPRLRGGQLGKPPKFTMLFMLLGTIAIPMWVPHVGTLVLTLTAVLPICLAALWAAYAVYLLWPNVFFLQSVVVALTFAILFASELNGLPTPLLAVFVTIYAVATGHFLMTPPLALTLAKVLSIAIVAAALLVVVLFSVVFPEYSIDAVWAGHHEALEHLHHMACHVVGEKPPRLQARASTTAARRLGASKTQVRALQAAVSGSGKALQLAPPPGAPADAADGDGDDTDSSDTDTEGAPRQVFGGARSFGRAFVAAAAGSFSASRRAARRANPLTGAQKVERSFYRLNAAAAAGAGALMGSRGELVLGFCGDTRPVIPWFPLLPAPKNCRIDPRPLTVLRADAVALALSLSKLHAALGYTDEASRPLLQDVAAGAGVSWPALREHLLGALAGLVAAFPQDHYPPPRPRLDYAHVDAFEAGAADLWGAWQRTAGGGGGGGSGGSGKGGGNGQQAKGSGAAPRLHASLLVAQLGDVAAELRRVYAAAQEAMDDLGRTTWGFLGLPCCSASA